MNQQKHTEDLHIGRGWLNRAAEMLDSCEDHLSDAEFALAAAEIGCGFIQLAAVEQQAEAAAGAAQHNERILEMQLVVADAHRALEDRVRAEQAEIELRTAKLAELDTAALAAAGRREERAAAEARPHDSCAICTPEPDDTVPPSCTFVHDSHRCVYELAQGEHTYHRLPDGREVDDRGELAPQEDDRG